MSVSIFQCCHPASHCLHSTHCPGSSLLTVGCVTQVAFVGFAGAALVARQGPIEALQAHLSDPVNNNIIGSIARLPETLGVPAVPSVPAPSA